MRTRYGLLLIALGLIIGTVWGLSSQSHDAVNFEVAESQPLPSSDKDVTIRVSDPVTLIAQWEDGKPDVFSEPTPPDWGDNYDPSWVFPHRDDLPSAEPIAPLQYVELLNPMPQPTFVVERPRYYPPGTFDWRRYTGGGGWLIGPRTATPEPATWAMLLLGFFSIGAVIRARKASKLSA